jgi:hypothetical protein
MVVTGSESPVRLSRSSSSAVTHTPHARSRWSWCLAAAWSRLSCEARAWQKSTASARSELSAAGDILFLYLGSAPIRLGEIVVFNVAGRRAQHLLTISRHLLTRPSERYPSSTAS